MQSVYNFFSRMLISVLILLFTPPVLASTAGTFGPVVNGGHRSIQYRNAYDPDNHSFSQRLHYQQSVNDDIMWRGVIQTRKTIDSDNDFDFFQGEVFWQLADISENWKHGVRFDARFRSDGRSNQLGLNWTNQFAISPDFSARVLLLSSFEYGSQSRSGVVLQSRGHIAYKVDPDWTLSLELFNNYGSTANFNGVSNQVHQIGPALAGKIGDGWQVFAGFLAGVTSASPDESYRFWMTKSF